MRFLRRLAGNGGHPLPLPLGKVAERSEDGEGIQGCMALSVTFGDSSPGGGAKGLHMLARKMERICTDTLHSLFYDHLSKSFSLFPLFYTSGANSRRMHCQIRRIAPLPVL